MASSLMEVRAGGMLSVRCPCVFETRLSPIYIMHLAICVQLLGKEHNLLGCCRVLAADMKQSLAESTRRARLLLRST